jgi:tryptophan halogenase
MDLFRSHGRIVRVDNELFSEVGWMQVFEGQNLVPDSHHPLADLQDEKDTEEYLESVREVIAKCTSVMPEHAAFIAQNCAAKPVNQGQTRRG